jgi:predicted GNAT family acetyltransferase
MTDVSVVQNPDRDRYEAFLGEELAGFAVYRLREGIIEFVHTEVDDAFEGHGVGSALARSALDDVRRDGTRKVVATCPFIKEWIERHDDYTDLLESA